MAEVNGYEKPLTIAIWNTDTNSYEEVQVLEGTVDLEEHSSDPSPLSFKVKTDQSTYFHKGTKLYMNTPYDGSLFFGVIVSAEFKDLPTTDVRFHDIEAIDNTYFAQKRIMAASYPNPDSRNYDLRGPDTVRVTDIVRDLILFDSEYPYPDNNALNQENVYGSYGTDEFATIKKLDIFSKRINFDYITVFDALDKMADLCDAVWWIDENKNLFFVPKYDRETTKVITEEDFQIQTLKISRDSSNYRNRQITKGGSIISEFQEYNVTVDDLEKNTKSYKLEDLVLKIPLYERPEIGYFRNDVYTKFDDDYVRVKEEEIAEGDPEPYFRWDKGDEVIDITTEFETQADPGDSYKQFVGTDELYVKYRGFRPIALQVDNPTEISNLADREGGSGIYEQVEDASGVDTVIENYAFCNGRLTLYGRENIEISFTTCDGMIKDQYNQRVRAGELVYVDLEDWGIKSDLSSSPDYVVQSIEVSDEYEHLWYDYTLTNEYINRSWRTVFKRGLQNEREEKELKIEQRSIPVEEDYAGADFYEDENPEFLQGRPNPCRRTYPQDDGSLVCTGSNNEDPRAYCQFDSARSGEIDGSPVPLECTHFEVTMENGDIWRKEMTDRQLLQQDTNYDNETRHSGFVATHEMNGTWKAIDFYGGVDIEKNYETATYVKGHDKVGTLIESFAPDSSTGGDLVVTDENSVIIQYDLLKDWT